jgi:fermentation-respiration switch protein FrsA (DUF1100 family)
MAGDRLPAVLLSAPSPQVKEQVADTYAAQMAAAGYVALTIDFRNFGASGGQPRLREVPAGKVADLRAAVSFLTGQQAVDRDRIGIIGICAGAGYALKAAALDPRIAAFVGISGLYPDPAALRASMGADAYRAALRDAITVVEREDRGAPVSYIQHVAPHGGNAFMNGGEPYEYYGTARGQAPNYRNGLTADTPYTALTLDGASAADLLSPTPALIIHGEKDNYCTPEQAQATYERLGEPKALIWMPVDTHIGFYDDASYITPAVAHAAAFLDEHLR